MKKITVFVKDGHVSMVDIPPGVDVLVSVRDYDVPQSEPPRRHLLYDADGQPYVQRTWPRAGSPVCPCLSPAKT